MAKEIEMKMEEKGHSLLFSLLLSLCENVDAMAGALATVLSHEMTWGMETIYAKTVKQTKRVWVLLTYLVKSNSEVMSPDSQTLEKK